MSFGVTTDYLKLSDTQYRPQSGNLEPTAAGEAQVQDSFGDVRASTVHGKAKAWTGSYKVIQGDSATAVFDLNSKVKLGQIVHPDSATNAMITGVDIALVNTALPAVSCNAVEFFGDTSNQPTYTIPDIATLQALKRAQAVGVVVATNNRLNSCNVSASIEVDQTADSLGVFVQTNGYKGRVEVTAEAVHATSTPALTVDSGWTAARDQAVATTNTEYGKGTLAVFRNLLPDS
jgi:hypothetical protein